jgi:CheY-like chemotaxis protein
MAKEIREILLIEDNPGDVRLTQEVLKSHNAQVTLQVVYDGEEALHYLSQALAKKRLPHIILLDLNLPRRNGLEVLEEIKKHPNLKCIPVIVLTSSDAAHDIHESYFFQANSYVTKPVDFAEFYKVITKIEEFWFTIAKLPY